MALNSIQSIILYRQTVIRNEIFLYWCEVVKYNYITKQYFRDGAERCGVFCAIYNCLQQMQTEDTIDVFTAVRHMRIRRPELCQTQVFHCCFFQSSIRCVTQKLYIALYYICYINFTYMFYT